jgi:hypothetical protein
MTSITEETVRKLAAFRSTGASVTTCYLDVESRQLSGRHELDRGFTALAKRLNTDDGGPVAASVVDDLARMERHVKAGFGRSGVRGLAMFSC